ncbi:histidine triad (HIT) family protein [Anaerosporobacter mobilis DSM 15930]|jgi:histidine triad (HIT) family protein|uniref:Histidine triad (HIT) family protein n=1 Tax=Anaerosporobacter mobilis DSM 15930 TaxID=1120996 RepID=A0A1M7IVP2_9FIRM|nr:HIT family protein [Anaerosporobacter mobilis]SHM44775.1 histidine triad (HIT) family protein [Anaerosporobacter mobilis DSM 15930]
MKDNCIFCKIAAGEIPSYTIYEDDDFKAFMDISPASKGHTILIPKVHADNLFELDETVASKLLPVAARIAKALKAELHCEGLNLLQNNGEIAGQTVFHFHMHIIPRYEVDKVVVKWVEDKYEGEPLDQLSEKIKKHL